MESGAFLDAAASGKLTGLLLLGWGADYPDLTNFLDYHFGAGASDAFRREVHRSHRVSLKEAASLAAMMPASRSTRQANNLIKQHVPMVPIAHGGSATAYKAHGGESPTPARWTTRLSQ